MSSLAQRLMFSPQTPIRLRQLNLARHRAEVMHSRPLVADPIVPHPYQASLGWARGIGA